MTKPFSPRVLVVSCQQMLVLMVYGDNGWSFCVVGEIIASLATPTTGIWGCMASGPDLIDPARGMDTVLAAPIPVDAGLPCFGSFVQGGVQKRLVRGNAVVPVGQSPLYSTAMATGFLLPVTMEAGDERELVGTLRQICLGPYSAGRKAVRDNDNVPRAISLNGGQNIIGSGLYLSHEV